ncbi:hypothetical protein, partial [Streptomyces sp. NPDC056730]|uniref:hypothetical protein n=1 Tax=Streptomyces sp. NPDC056730 TaxID=3345929 RepID=UPI00368899B6
MTALTDVLLAIAVVGVAGMWAQRGVRSVHAGPAAGRTGSCVRQGRPRPGFAGEQVNLLELPSVGG